MNKCWVILVAVAILVVLVIAAIAVAPRSDQWFVQRFQKHKHELDELVMLLQTNQIIFVQRHSSRPDVLLQTSDRGVVTEVTTFSSEGKTLHRLFDSIRCECASRAGDETAILPPRHGWEDLYPGGFKAFVFRTSSPPLLVKDLDDYRRRNRGRYNFYRALEGAWYLKYEEAH